MVTLTTQDGLLELHGRVIGIRECLACSCSLMSDDDEQTTDTSLYDGK